jgi:hypothetical protein
MSVINLFKKSKAVKVDEELFFKKDYNNPLDGVMKTGKYKGKKFSEVLKTDSTYAKWYIENMPAYREGIPYFKEAFRINEKRNEERSRVFDVKWKAEQERRSKLTQVERDAEDKKSYEEGMSRSANLRSLTYADSSDGRRETEEDENKLSVCGGCGEEKHSMFLDGGFCVTCLSPGMQNYRRYC